MKSNIFFFLCLIMAWTHPQHASTTKGCCPSLTKLQALHKKVEKETIMEAIALLSMTTKKNIQNRMNQIPRSVLEESLAKIERTYQKLQTIQKSSSNTEVKKSVTPDLVFRTRYLVNKIKETLKEYERGDRGGRGYLGHAGTSEKSRQKKQIEGHPAPTQTIERIHATQKAAKQTSASSSLQAVSSEDGNDFEPPAKRQKISKHTQAESSHSITTQEPASLEECTQSALAACAKGSKNKTFLSAAVVIDNSAHPEISLQGALLKNLSPEHAHKHYIVHPSQAKNLLQGDIFCVKAIKPEKMFDRNIVYGFKAPGATCSIVESSL
jgi:hypothetical protein